MLTETQRKALSKIYYNANDSGSFGGVNRLFIRAKHLGISSISRNLVKEFLAEQDAYTLHRPARRRFVRNRTYVHGIDHQWQADLADMQGLEQDNNHKRYLLTVIDVFSKYAWVVPVNNKDSKAITKAFHDVLEFAAPRKPERLQTDKGKEFFNKEFERLMKNSDINHFASESDQKAAVVERFNRTLKTRIWTYLSAKRTNRWYDVLPKIVESYNNSYHRSIGMSPIDVKKTHENKIWARLYGDGDTIMKRERANVPINSMVRVSKVKGHFEKGYMPNWSREHFIVSNNKGTVDGGTFGGAKSFRNTYKLKDYDGEEIKGTWYNEELQPIRNNEYRIEKVIRKRIKADGSAELLVKWLGWPEKFNSWIKNTDIYN